MASISMQQPVVLDNGAAPGKLRSRVAMKPILKKLHSHSESDRTSSFDTDRDWDDQPSPLSFPPLEYYGSMPDPVTTAPGALINTNSAASPTTAVDSSRQTRDVSFSISSTSTSEYTSHASRFKHSHIRSPSGNSHVSIATSNSGRNGSFVHPFQQIPRAATPPLSYANSIASQDTAAQPLSREYTSVIAENDEALTLYSEPPYSDAPLSTPPLYSSFGGSQRSSSDFVQISRQPPAVRSNSGPVPHPNAASAIHRSVSDVQASSLPQSKESALLSSTAPITTSVLSGTPNSATSPLSPLRNSLDMNGFRIRSRSEVDPATRQEQVREARRKFEAKEKAKDEKYATKQLRKRERADNREACRQDRKQHARLRKESSATASISSNGRSSSSNGTPSRKSTGPSVMREKTDFASTDYTSAPTGTTPKSAEEVQFQAPKRRRTAKRKTTGVWTSFVLWLRTGIFRMGRR